MSSCPHILEILLINLDENLNLNFSGSGEDLRYFVPKFTENIRIRISQKRDRRAGFYHLMKFFSSKNKFFKTVASLTNSLFTDGLHTRRGAGTIDERVSPGHRLAH